MVRRRGRAVEYAKQHSVVTPAPSTTAPSTTAAPVSPTSASSSPEITAPPTTPTPSPTDTGQQPQSGSGAAELGTTHYPIPANALFVSPTGSDSSSGLSTAAPVRTLAHAVQIASSGQTIVLRAGSYHESVSVPSNKRLTVQSYPGEVVWLDGSTSVGGWSRDGNTWVHSGWTAQFDSTPAYSAGGVSSAPGWSFVNPAYPMAAHPDQVWIGDTALRQVGSRAEVVPGTFYADYAAQALVTGTDPTGTDVRASDLTLAYSVYSPGSVLRGIGIRRYATSIPLVGTVRMDGPGDSIENVMVSDNATTGVTVDSTNVTLRNVTAVRNGLLGLHANYADGISLSNVLATNNNTEHFNQSPVSGGTKITRTRGITVRDSVFSDNFGYGLWLDESCYDMTVVGNTIATNSAHGLSVEISARGTVADNVVADR